MTRVGCYFDHGHDAASSLLQTPVAVDRANATFAVRRTPLAQPSWHYSTSLYMYRTICSLTRDQVRKQNWELPRVVSLKGGGGAGGGGEGEGGEGGGLPVLEGRGSSVKRSKGIGDKETVRFR